MIKDTLGALVGIAIAATPAAAATNLLFILDASNSMWGQVDGVAKIEIAKTALINLVSDLPADTAVGLAAYGHTQTEACDDVELVAPIGSLDRQEAQNVLPGITPKGKTPIAFALLESERWFSGTAAPANNNVVLISDGLETCDGDPCAAAEALNRANIAARVHVVGFDLSEQDRAALECISEMGKGQYFSANSTEDFNLAIQDALVESTTYQVAQAAPAPAEPAVHFSDDFDGSEPAGHWTVLNADLNGYLVESSELLLVRSGIGGFNTKDTPNIFKLNEPLPGGDWDLVAHFKAGLNTGRDQIWLGFMDDDQNYTAAAVFTSWGDNPGYCASLTTRVYRSSNGQISNFDKLVAGTKSCGMGGMDTIAPVIEQLEASGGQLILAKRGRQYSATLVVNENDGSQSSYTTEAVSTLRPSGYFALAAGQWEARKGETSLFVDRIEVLAR